MVLFAVIRVCVILIVNGFCIVFLVGTGVCEVRFAVTVGREGLLVIIGR